MKVYVEAADGRVHSARLPGERTLAMTMALPVQMIAHQSMSRPRMTPR